MTDTPKALSETTLKTYNGCIKRLNDIFDDDDYLTDPKIVIDYLKQNYPNLSSNKTYLSALLWYVKDKSKSAYDAYKAEIDKLRPQVALKETNQTLTKSQEENYIKWSILKNAGRSALKMYNEGKISLADALVCLLYTEQVPVRADYINMIFIRDIRKATNKNTNYCLLRVRNPVFIFQEYKTAGKYGRVVIKIKPIVYKLLVERHNQMIDEKATNLLFTDDQPNFSRRVKNAFNKVVDKEVSINLIRHSFLTDFLSKNPSLREKQRISEMMMNSPAVAEAYRVLSEPTISETDLDKEMLDADT
jgi:hypothetical protein